MEQNRSHSPDNTDGRLFPVRKEDIVQGTCLRMVNSDGTAPPFSDFLVQRVKADDTPRATVRVTLARPLAFVSGAGTSCPSVLTGVETIVVDFETLTKEDSMFRVLVTARGAVHTHTT